MIPPGELLLGREPYPDEAQFRFDTITGKHYIYVEEPCAGRFSDMPPEKFAELQRQIMSTQPTQEEIQSGFWNDA